MRPGDPGLFALRSAARAALVMPTAFALALVVFDLKQAALFASLGSMAMLVFVDFGGPRRARLRAYLGLAATGAVLIPLGTLCSHSPALATVAMALVGFAILFAGVLNAYVAAAQAGAILGFVLAVMVPAGADQIPARLAGWGLAATLCTAAALLLWPRRPRSAVRAAAARTARALAALVVATAAGDAGAEAVSAEALRRIRSLRHDFISMQNRPSGTGGRTAALARLIDDLGQLRPLAARAAAPAAVSAPFARPRAEIEALVPAVLGEIADHLAGGLKAPSPPSLGQLRLAHRELGEALLEHFRQLGPDADEEAATRELDEAYRLRLLAFVTIEAAAEAPRATGARSLSEGESPRERLGATRRVARAHASMRSVWLRNSLRGAAGLAAAVLVAQVGDLQHGFWVVLGTLSVLRSNALATGSTLVWALLGTLAGIVAGGLLVEAVGGSEAALWALLPLAVFGAAYARRAFPFAVGQAAFSVVVLVLFNLLEPAGWEVGLTRVEDVAIGAGVSLLVGVLLWPRGAAVVLRQAIGTAYLRSAAYLGETVSALLGSRHRLADAAREAFASGQVLDATVRDYLAGRSSPRDSVEDMALLVAGATRLRRAARLLQHAHVLVRLTPVDVGLPRLAQARDAFEAERDRRCGWYAAFGEAVAAGAALPEPEPPLPDAGAAPQAVVLERPEGEAEVPPGVAIAWAHRHLETLRELEPALVRAGAEGEADEG